MKKLFVASLFVLVLVPDLAFGAAKLATQQGNPVTNSGSGGACSTLTSEGLNGIVNCLLGIMDKVVVLLMAGAVVYVVYGAFLMVSSEEKRQAGKDTVIYGIIGLFVMVSIWGLVNILTSTFNLQGGYIAPVQLHQP
ncbi:MAG TPA: hypothetical protein VFQ72_04320 [Candidatus Paceibacterota bacterium]|nr:hypothetical protein [Candidatus Paceibacterota bacterium]